MLKALDDLLAKRDPVLKAARAAARLSRHPSAPGQNAEAAPLQPIAAELPANQPQSPPSALGQNAGGRRPAIPAAIRHAVFARDEGRCTWRFPGGDRCGERAMLEIDHVKPWCRGGEHQIENLALLCRHHNQYKFETLLGRPPVTGPAIARHGFLTPDL